MRFSRSCPYQNHTAVELSLACEMLGVRPPKHWSMFAAWPARPHLCWNRDLRRLRLGSRADRSVKHLWLHRPAAAAVGLAVDAATIAVRACFANGIPFKDTCSGLKMNVYLPGDDAAPTTGHIIGAIATHPTWARLTYGTNSSQPGWYVGDARCMGNGPLMWCDEYPFMSTQEGGKAGGASLKLVPMKDQVIQRTTLSYRPDWCPTHHERTAHRRTPRTVPDFQH
jgi:hypothetical protein